MSTVEDSGGHDVNIAKILGTPLGCGDKTEQLLGAIDGLGDKNDKKMIDPSLGDDATTAAPSEKATSVTSLAEYQDIEEMFNKFLEETSQKC